MTDLATLQQQFMQVLQGGESGQLLQQVIDQGSIDSQSRIDIYRHAYQQRLKISIESDHEILGLYLGDELFDKMVAGYISSYPSQQSSLRYFAEQLPRFLSEQEPFNQYPVIAELARFERLMLAAFDARDADVVGSQVLNDIEYQDWPGLQFRLHPSVQCFQSQWNSVSVWQALKQGQTPPEPFNQNNAWLIWRNTERLTEFMSLDNWQMIILQSMIEGRSYAEICESLADELTVEQISESSLQCVINWLQSGIISQVII